MQTRFKGRTHVFGDSIDTDMITPGKYLTILDAKMLGEHVLEGADPDFPKRVKPGEIIVAGENFGCGSSREHAPLAIQGAGVPVVVAQSFARIFYRNSINVGLPVLECPGIKGQVRTGDEVDVEILKGEVLLASGMVLKGIGLSGKPLEILEAGGLVPYTRKRIGKA
ncbi:MAG TPA: 3-isopropylmalate dehydratase small subunit [Thermoplasmata archaeon]|nr:3-isopropylmalate dehydratase small subunit [Thermoplasmata archaeon]